MGSLLGPPTPHPGFVGAPKGQSPAAGSPFSVLAGAASGGHPTGAQEQPLSSWSPGGGLGSSGAWPAPTCSSDSLSLLGICRPPQLPPSFPVALATMSNSPGASLHSPFPQAGWSRPSFHLNRCFPRAGRRPSCPLRPSLRALGHGVTGQHSASSRRAKVPLLTDP